MTPVLLDTSVIVALLDRSERRHRECATAIEANSAPLITCEAVIAEACYLMRGIMGAPEAILSNVAAGVFEIPIQLSGCAVEIQLILRKYRDREVDLADACLIHLATKLGTGDILTLDSDFMVYRWGRSHPFNPLLPLW